MILQYPTVAVETFYALRFVIRKISYSLELSSCICAIRYKPVLETTTSSANANQAKEAPKFIQPSEFANLPSDIANSSVELYNPGPSTHGCRTPEICETFCYHQHHCERNSFACDKSVAESKSIDLKCFLHAKLPTPFSILQHRVGVGE